MKCILMNKNNEILVAEYISGTRGFSEIIKIKNIDYAPLILKNSYYKNNYILDELIEWFKGRGIPDWRDDLDLLLNSLNIDVPSELLDKAFGLSLSDQYWLKPFDKDIRYEDINFFLHDFSYTEFTNVTFSKSPTFNTQISLISPNNTTDGRLKKAWIIENGKRCLLKGGYKNEVMQPFNEVLASMISMRLGFDYTNYTLKVVKDKVVSKCECFIDENTEFITAYQILHNNCKRENAYEDYIKILEDNGISNARISIENMFVLDYLMLNEDRHLNNFGVIRNVDTLKWEKICPIFDTGQSLNILDYSDEDEVLINGDGRFFYNVSDFDTILSLVKDIKRFDMKKLDGVVEEFDDLLHKYTEITKMSDRRINKICTLLYSRIQKLKRYIEQN